MGIFSLIFFFGIQSQAQANEDSHNIQIVVPKSSTIHIKGNHGGAISLAPEAPLNAGQPLKFETSIDSSLWLNYSAVSQEGKNIYASIVAGSLPAGLGLTVDATTSAENGQGNIGQSLGRITLSNVNQRLVKDITNCYTGEGANKGRQLAYELVSLQQYSTIQANSNTNITVCYTITD